MSTPVSAALALLTVLAAPVASFGPVELQPVYDAMTVDATVLDYLKQQNQTGEPHLWFYYVSTDGNDDAFCKKTGQCRCGDIDAATRMPAELFKPQNIVALARYATLTIKSYTSLGMGGDKLKLGRCSRQTEYVCGGGGVQGINWVNKALMGPICKTQCDCNYPACRDQPDDPAAGKFCSLCGPKYNDYIVINLFNLPNTLLEDDDGGSQDYGPCGELLGKTIVQVVEADPNLSTLRAALKAADLNDALLKPGPFTLFAPTNKAFAALPFGTLAKLLLPKNKAQLVDLLTKHVHPGAVRTTGSRPLKDGQKISTLQGTVLTSRVSYPNGGGAAPTVLINSALIVTADEKATDSVVHIIDGVL